MHCQFRKPMFSDRQVTLLLAVYQCILALTLYDYTTFVTNKKDIRENNFLYKYQCRDYKVSA